MGIEYFVFTLSDTIFTNNHFKLINQILNSYPKVVIFFLLNADDEDLIDKNVKKDIINLYFTEEQRKRINILDSFINDEDKIAFMLDFIGTDKINELNRLHIVSDLKFASKINELKASNKNLNTSNISYEYFVHSKAQFFDAKGEKIISRIVLEPIILNSLITYNVNARVFNYILEHNLLFTNKIKEHLKEKRLAHSISVANLSYKVAVANSLPNAYKYYICALLHDIGKEEDKIKEARMMRRYFKNYVDLPEYSYHQFIGAHIALRDFKINDSEILDAIACHCTGKANMSDMSKIVYACDKIDPLRGYDSSDMINAMMNNFESGFIYVLNENLKFLTSKSKLQLNQFDRLSKECFEFYLNK